MTHRRRYLVLGLVAVAILLAGATPALAAYHHMGEIDSGVFLNVHPEVRGTKLDSCSLCHSGGSYSQSGRTVNLGSCQWCHYKFGYDGRGDIRATLNRYGRDYFDFTNLGRTAAAVRYIDNMDSDGDGYSNADEIAAVRFPGDPDDDPTKIMAPARVYTMAQLKALPKHTQFVLMNATKSTDDFTEYAGVTVATLLTNAGMLPSTSGIKVFAPDGFSQYHPLDPETHTVTGMYPVRWTYPQQTYWYDPLASIQVNPATGWCNYASPRVAGRTSGSLIENPDGLKLLLAYERDGGPLDVGELDESNKLNGEGPYRLVTPQLVPSPPDQRSTNPTAAPIWPFDSNADHNAGYSSRTATIIKVEPLPAGMTDIDTMEAGWDYVDDAKIVVYGAIDPFPTSRARLSAMYDQIRRMRTTYFVGGAATRNRILSTLRAADARMRLKDEAGAIAILQAQLMSRFDGRVAYGRLSRPDWIRNTALRKRAYWQLNEMVVLLRSAP